MLTYDGSNVRAYVNGSLTRTISSVTGSLQVTNGLLYIGSRSRFVSWGYWLGQIDEVSIYNQAASATDVQNIYNTGRGGKCKSALTTNEISVAVINTPAHQNQNFTFTATVTNHGSLPATGVVLNATLPTNLNFVSADTGCAYDSASRRVTCTIGTIAANFAGDEANKSVEQSNDFAPTASATRNIVVTPTVQGALQTIFTATANEADAVVANNLFAANVNVFAPTAAGVSIGGRVTTANGRGVRNTLVTMTAADGSTRTVLSSAFGNYRFGDVATGQTVILRISAKRFRFVPNTRIVNVTDDIVDADFTAQP